MQPPGRRARCGACCCCLCGGSAVVALCACTRPKGECLMPVSAGPWVCPAPAPVMPGLACSSGHLGHSLHVNTLQGLVSQPDGRECAGFYEQEEHFVNKSNAYIAPMGSGTHNLHTPYCLAIYIFITACAVKITFSGQHNTTVCNT